MINLGTVALDGTKVAANTASHTLDKLEREVAEILRQAAETDQREDLEHGQARGDELPEVLASKADRLARQCHGIEVDLPPAELFAESRLADGGGWGRHLTEAAVHRWRMADW